MLGDAARIMFLQSYAYLIQHESDCTLAHQRHLLPANVNFELLGRVHCAFPCYGRPQHIWSLSVWPAVSLPTSLADPVVSSSPLKDMVGLLSPALVHDSIPAQPPLAACVHVRNLISGSRNYVGRSLYPGWRIWLLMGE